MKKVSIIVPIYNMGDSLTECLESILKQTYKNYEVILVDDGSIDNSFEICQAYSSKFHFIKSWSIKNQGSGNARNYGIDKASGEYVYFIDADDIVSVNALETLVEKMENSDQDLIVFGYKRFDAKGNLFNVKKYENNYFSGEFVRNHYHLFFNANAPFAIQGAPWNKFFKMDIIKKYNVLYPNLRRHQDEVFISRYVEHITNVYFINEVLYTHFLNDSKKIMKKFPIDYIDIVHSLYGYRKSIILNWNKKNKEIEKDVYVEYIYNLLKSFDTIFNKKFKMTYQDQIEWIRNKSKEIIVSENWQACIVNINKPKKIQIYLFLKSIERKQYKNVYLLLKSRNFLERYFNSAIDGLRKSMVKKNTTETIDMSGRKEVS